MPATRDSYSGIDSPPEIRTLFSGCPRSRFCGGEGAGTSDYKTEAGGPSVCRRSSRFVFAFPPARLLPQSFIVLRITSRRNYGTQCRSHAFGQRHRPVRTGLARPFGWRATGRPAPGAAFSFGRDLPGVRWPDNRQKVLLNCSLQFGRLGPKVVADKMWITSKRSFRRNPAIIRFFARTKEQYSCRCPS